MLSSAIFWTSAGAGLCLTLQSWMLFLPAAQLKKPTTCSSPTNGFGLQALRQAHGVIGMLAC